MLPFIRFSRISLQYYPYKMSYIQLLLPTDYLACLTFSLEFLPCCQVDVDWLWNIIWQTKLIFIWIVQWLYTFATSGVLKILIWFFKLNCKKVTVWCRFASKFLLDFFFFFQRINTKMSGDMLCTGRCYASLLDNNIVLSLQVHQCLDRATFMQDGALPHFATCI